MVECPVCGWRGKSFLPRRGRRNAVCPACGSYERHRHQFLVCSQIGLLAALPNYTVLHVAEFPCEAHLLPKAKQRFTCDIAGSRNHLLCRLEKLPFRDNAFDLIWASHVLEHIREVPSAVAEIYRSLVPGGRAMLDVPTYGERTLRLPEPDPEGHVWRPGSDWTQFYRSAGFKVGAFPSDWYASRFSLIPSELVAVCTK